MRLHDVDIMGKKGSVFGVHSWYWSKHISKASGKDMIKVQYYSKLLSDPNISEYFPITHDGFAGQKARMILAEIASKAGVKNFFVSDIDEICQVMNGGMRPNEISYKKEGKFYKVTGREW